MYLAVEKNHCERYIGLSPNGKATDSDSVIFKVRILVAQRKKELHTGCRCVVLFCRNRSYPRFQLKTPPEPYIENGIRLKEIAET